MREIKTAKVRKVGQTKAKVGTWQVTNNPKVVNTTESPLWNGKNGWFHMKKKYSKSVPEKIISWYNARVSVYWKNKKLVLFFWIRTNSRPLYYFFLRFQALPASRASESQMFLCWGSCLFAYSKWGRERTGLF